MSEHHDETDLQAAGGRRRRLVWGGAVLAVAAVAVGSVLALTLGGDDDDTAEDGGPASTGAGGEGSISITDASGTVRVFAADELAVGCMGEGDEERLVLSRADLLPGILAGDPPAPDSLDDGPFPVIQIDVDQAPVGEELSLPLDDDLDDAVILFFVVDDGGQRANELSSDRDDASGTVTVREAECGSDPRLDLTLDTILGSEVDQGALPMEGTYRFS